MTALVIREAIPSDEAALVALWTDCGLVVSYNDPGADFQFAVRGPSSAVLLGEDASGCIRAAAMTGHDGHRGWLYYVAADPQARAEGLGRQIVEAAEDWLRRRGVAKVQLLVREANAKAVAFYHHLGYDVTPRIVMAKWL